MKDFRVKIELVVEAENEKEAEIKFWDCVDNRDYEIKPEIIEE